MSGVINPKIGFSYDAPTQYTDGTSLDPTAITKYQIGLGQTSGNYTLIVDDVQFENGQQTTPFSVVGKLAYGQWYAAVRDVVNGINSAWSTEVAFEVQPIGAMPPTNFSVA